MDEHNDTTLRPSSRRNLTQASDVNRQDSSLLDTKSSLLHRRLSARSGKATLESSPNPEHSGKASPVPSTSSHRSLSLLHRPRSQRQSYSAGGVTPNSSAPSRNSFGPGLHTSSSGTTAGGLPTLKNLESYSAQNVAAALEPGGETKPLDDSWKALAIRVLPLFNGEPIRGFVEDLNRLVSQHLENCLRKFSSRRSNPSSKTNNPSTDLASLVTGIVTSDLMDLLRIGLQSLALKLNPTPPLNEENFSSELNSIWLFFLGACLPNLEAVFWPLASDTRLQTTGASASSSGIQVRKLALIAFRDEIVLTRIERIANLVYDDVIVLNSQANVTSLELQIARRRRQMICLLASVLTDDDRQYEIDSLLAIMRGSPNPNKSTENEARTTEENFARNSAIPLYDTSQNDSPFEPSEEGHE